MTDIRSMVQDPRFRKKFEKLLRLAARKGDAEQVAERLSWGIDPNCANKNARTPLILNVRGHSPNAALVRVLLQSGADASLTDITGLSALDYARRKLARLLAKPRREPEKSPSLDENNQLQLSPDEQKDFDEVRKAAGGDREYLRIWWQERLKAARRVFNDPAQVEAIIEILEKV